MKKFRFTLFALLIICLTSCTLPKEDTQIPAPPTTDYIEETDNHFDNESSRIPLNFDYQRGIWIPYLQYEEIMQGKTKEEFKTLIHEKIDTFLERGINTIYVHAHPCGDSYYNSEIFPKGTFLDGNYDPLEIIIEEAHNSGVSVHAWINPLRCQTVEEIPNLNDDFVIKQWVTSGSDFVGTVNNRYYLNPAYDEVISLICECVSEILGNYDVDGIHIDDYFYPTKEPEFDSKAFTESGSNDLSEWRIQNCDKLVKSIYDTVKSYDNRVLFGISPQGNIEMNYESQFADVKKWSQNEGYCDYILPQIYFGFNNATCPFEETLKEWENLLSESNVSLVIGLAEYKLGKEDTWAGETGINEWIENPDIINQQVKIVEASTADGYAFY